MRYKHLTRETIRVQQLLRTFLMWQHWKFCRHQRYGFGANLTNSSGPHIFGTTMKFSMWPRCNSKQQCHKDASIWPLIQRALISSEIQTRIFRDLLAASFGGKLHQLWKKLDFEEAVCPCSENTRMFSVCWKIFPREAFERIKCSKLIYILFLLYVPEESDRNSRDALMFLICFMNGDGGPDEDTLRTHHGWIPIFWHGTSVFKLLMWNEIIKGSISELSILKGAETFMSTISIFEAWRRRQSLLCGTLFRLY